MDSILSWTWQPCDNYTRSGQDIKGDTLPQAEQDEEDDEEWDDDSMEHKDVCDEDQQVDEDEVQKKN
jgi:hypothetical protein